MYPLLPLLPEYQPSRSQRNGNASLWDLALIGVVLGVALYCFVLTA